MRWVWLVLGGLLVACRGAAPEWTFRGETSANDGAAGDAPSGMLPGPSDADAGRGVAAVAGAAGAGASVEGEALDSDAGCGAEHITLEEAHSGNVRAAVPVAVGPLVASSQKFLVSEAKSGSCLWGAFAADPERGGKGSGLFVVSFGAPHVAGEACRAGSDALPDDLAPGDLLELEGRLEAYAPAACSSAAPALQLRVDATCPARRIGTAALPEATLIDRALADELALGKSVELLRAWGGVLVQLSDVSAEQDAEDGDAVGLYGVIRLRETQLEVHSRLGFFDLSAAGPRDPTKAPRFAYPVTFRSVTGLVFLDYCTWALGPRESCHDLSPPSQQCRQPVESP